MATKNKKQLDFNQSMQQLERIVATMETEQLSLDEALKNYQKGIDLVHSCQKALTKAEQTVVKLSQEDNFTSPTPFTNQ